MTDGFIAPPAIQLPNAYTATPLGSYEQSLYLFFPNASWAMATPTQAQYCYETYYTAIYQNNMPPH